DHVRAAVRRVACATGRSIAVARVGGIVAHAAAVGAHGGAAALAALAIRASAEAGIRAVRIAGARRADLGAAAALPFAVRVPGAEQTVARAAVAQVDEPGEAEGGRSFAATV